MTQISKLLFLDIIWDIVYFPIWWYSRGLTGALKWVGIKIINLERTLGLDIWLLNLFRPMYGQSDLAGKLVSFFMRIVQIIFRGIVLIVGSVVYIILLGLWLIAPIVVFVRVF